MKDLRKSNFNKLYVGFVIAIVSITSLGSPIVTYLFVAISIIIAIAEMVKVHTDKVELQHDILKFQLFLFIILLIPISLKLLEFLLNIPRQISFLKPPQTTPGASLPTGSLHEEISLRKVAFRNFLSSSIALIGIIIAYLGIGKYLTDTKSNTD